MNDKTVSVFATYRLLVQSYRQTWFSLLMACLSLLVACAGLSAVLLVNEGAKQSYSGQSAPRILPAQYQIVTNADNQTLSLDDYLEIKRLGISRAVAIAETAQHLYVNQQQITQRRAKLIGIDFLALLNRAQVSKTKESENTLAADGDGTTQETFGALSFASPTTIMHPNYLKELGIDAETKLSIDALSTINLPPISTRGSNGLADTLVLDIGVLLELDSRAELRRILLLSGTSAEQIELVKSHLPSHLKLESIAAEQTGPQMTQSFYLNLFAMALLMFAVCLFIVMNAFNLLMFKRFAMLKVFRQLGIGRLQILLAHIFEFTVLVLVVSAIGVVLGSELALLASPAIRGIIEGLYRVQVGFADITWLSLYLKVVLISVAGLALALFSPMKQLNRSLSKIQSDNKGAKFNIIIMGICMTLALMAFAIFQFSTQLSLLLVGAAFVILSGCCALIVLFPKCLMLLFKFIPERFTLTRLSVAQALFLSRKTKIACCAFFIAATSNLGMNLMVDSFRDSTQTWLDQRLVADHYLYSDDASINANLANIAKQSGVRLYPRFEQSIEFEGTSTQLFSYPIEPAFKEAMVFEQRKANPWESFEDSRSVFINQQLAIRKQLSLDDSITFTHPLTQQSTSFQISGIIYDYGNPSGQILLNASEFKQDISQASIFAILSMPEQIEKFQSALVSSGVNLQNQFFKTEDLLSESMQVFDRTFIITDSLNLITLMVAALSLACTIVVLLDQSRPQTMLLRAMGVTNLQSRRLLLQQYLFLCAVALVAATPFGILLSNVLIYQINYHAFNWSYPLVINWLSIFRLYSFSLLIVFIVIALPIIYTTKHGLAQELKWLD